MREGYRPCLQFVGNLVSAICGVKGLIMQLMYLLRLALTKGQRLHHVLRSGTVGPTLTVMCFAGAVNAQTMKAPDITKTPTLYVVPYAHLDTQWRWNFPQTISNHLLKTMRVNFDYMDKYPHYVFNWSGSNRYRLMKEYYPNDYARLKQYVAEGRWFPAGSSVEEGDVNLPSAEGLFRQVLYGNEYFREDFGKASSEFMLPDCFGFPASLPTILAHAGVKGFSTQKLNAGWQPAPLVGGPDSPEQTPVGIPFNVGLWFGPDGKSVIAALNPGGYGSRVHSDLSQPPPQLTPQLEAQLTPDQKKAFLRSRDTNWVDRINLDGKVTGVFADYHYVGTGDTGGATNEETVKILEATVARSETSLPLPPGFPAPAAGTTQRLGEGPVHVVESASDQMFNDIKPDMIGRMPSYKGDLELINHSAGSLTSQAYHKRWVIKNELLADAAEKSSLAAEWLGARTYPQQRLTDAWVLSLAGHFHDTAAGTATPRAYQFAWNDDLIAANQFAGILTTATEAVASGLDTQTTGVSIVVFNPLTIAREDVAEASVDFARGAPKGVRVFGADGHEVPSQLEGGKVLFLAKVPSVGYAVYDIRPTATAASSSSFKATESSLENHRYRVHLDQNGDVASIYDKSLNRELLSGPIRLAITTDVPKIYPAWNMDYEQVEAAPRAYVDGPAKVRITENGPVRVSLEVTRETEGSRFTQTISLSAGDAGNRVEFGNAIDWRGLTSNLKASIPLAASNQEATYNWEVGTIQRPNAVPRQFEVASHRWIDLTDKSGTFGTTILTDVKNGSDKPTDNTLRLTLVRSPGMQPTTNGHPPGFSDQSNQDWGHHEFLFGLTGHEGDWRTAQTDWQAYRLNDPLITFITGKHSGALGKSFSLLHLNNSRIRVLALKKAEDSDEIIVRMVELDGKAEPDVRVSFAAPVIAAREVNGQEQPVGPASVHDGALATSFTPYEPRTFALRLGASTTKLASIQSQPVALQYDLAIASNDDTKTIGGGFDGNGNAMPAEMLPNHINYHGVQFNLAPARTGSPNAVIAKGQTIHLPAGRFNRIYILAASADGDQTASFLLGDRAVSLKIQDGGGFIGQWDTRIWKNLPQTDWAISANHAVWPPPDMEKREKADPIPSYPGDYIGLEAGFVKPAGVAWYASHHHTADGLNQPYQYSYLFAYSIDINPNERTLVLPDNTKIRILAVSVAQENPELKPAQPLFDTLNRTEPPQAMEKALP
jgi:alpha-mannosidase